MVTQQLQEIRQRLQQESSTKWVESHKKFVPGITNAWGVPMPVLNELAVTYKQGGFELVEALWQGDMLEEKVLAAKLLGKMAGKDTERSLQLINNFQPV